MGLLNFKQGQGIAGNTMQEYINSNFPICPICGSHHPNWTFKVGADLSDWRIRFRCQECESVLSMTSADLSGFSKLAKSKNPLTWAYTGQATAINAISKTIKGKKVTTTYVKIDAIGNVRHTDLQEGKEIPLEEMQARMMNTD